MSIHGRRLISTVTAGILLLGGLGIATAQEETQEEGAEGRGFTFRVDPIVLGVLETDNDTGSAKLEEYRDLDSGFLIPLLHLVGESADGERIFDFRADNAAREDARYTLNYGVVGRYNLLLDHNKIVHRFGNDGRMLWTRTSPGRYEIADPVQAQIQGAIETQFNANRAGVTFPFLNTLLAPHLATAQRIDVGLQRDRTLARLDLGRMGRLAWGLEYTHERRDGTRPYGGSFGFNNVTEIPEPIDYDTTGAELAGEWNGAGSGLRFGYRHSRFENNVSTVLWDNPFRVTGATDASAYLAPGSGSIGGSAVGFADLAPDNRSDLLFVNGRTRFGGSWWANGSAAYNVMRQDDPLLPYTLNPAITGIGFNGQTFNATDPANLPVRRADTEVDTLNLTAQAGTRFSDAWDLTFRYRYSDYDNQSPRVQLPGYVRFHAVWEEIPRITVPYAYTRQDAGAELGWDLARSTRFTLAYTLKTIDREFREVDSSDEDLVELSVDTRPADWITLRASYALGDRTIDGYDPEAQEFSFLHPEGVNNQPGLRKYDQAARDFDAYDLQAQLFPTGAWSFTVGLSGRAEDFAESQFGLISDDTLQYNVELGYAPGEDFNVYLFGHRIDRETFQRARQSGGTVSTNPLDDWQVTFDEINDVWGLGLTTRLAPRWTGDVSARWSRSDGEADFFSPPGGSPDTAADFDNYEDIELLALLGRVDYRLDRRTGVGLWYRYEDYTIDSFIFQGLRNYLPGALLLNANNGDYQANIFGLDLSFSF
jgi:MtrB/PioB family decaheme-associated outer membrane protein